MVLAQRVVFADLLRQYRRATDMTQEELAHRAGLSVQAVSALERGVNHRPRRDTVELLADALALGTEERADFNAAARRRRIAGSPPTAPGNGLADETAAEASSEEQAVQLATDSTMSAPPFEQRLPVGGFLGALPESRLVARDAEVAQLFATIEMVLGGAGRLVLLVGESGIGKTRLAQEVMLLAQTRAFIVASGRCYEPQQTVPYYPFLETLTRAYAAAPASIRAEAPRRWNEVARLLPDLDTDVPVSQSGGSGREEQQRLFWQVASFLQALAVERPLALLIDDLHWADGASLALLQHLARHTRNHPILLLGTYRDTGLGRDHPLDATVRDLIRERLLERVQIQRLSEAGTQALIAAAMGEEKVTLELAHLLYGRTEGNPFFTQEVLHALIDRGDVFQQDGRWDQRAIEDIVVPDSVRSVIGQRLAHLSTDTQATLHEAAVLGQVFTFEDLQATSARDEATLELALEEAIVSGLVREADGDRYTFNHALTQQALYAELPMRRKRRLHLAAAEAIERAPEREQHRRATELVWHFLEAKDAARALPYALKAGEQAAAVYAHAGAERYYRTALNLARDTGDRAKEAEALERLGRTLHVMGRGPEASELLMRAAEMYSALGDSEGYWRTSAWRARRYYLLEGGRPDDGWALLAPLLQAAVGAAPSRAVVELHLAAARLRADAGQYQECLSAIEQAVQTAGPLGDLHLLGEALFGQAGWLMFFGRFAEAIQTMEATIEVMEKAGDLIRVPVAFDWIADMRMRMGRFREAERALDRAGAVAVRTDRASAMLHARASHARWAFLIGDWKRARADYDSAEEMRRQHDRGEWQPWILAGMGRLDMAEGAIERGSRLLHEAISLGASARIAGNEQVVQEAVAALAEQMLLTGAAEQAQTTRAGLRTFLRRLNPHIYSVSSILPYLAWTHLILGEDETAADVLDQCAARTRAEQNRLAEVDMLRIRALVESKRGRWELAATALDEALMACRTMPHPYAEAKALYVYGRLHAAKGEPERAREKYEQALSICHRLGEGLYRPDIERALVEVTSEANT